MNVREAIEQLSEQDPEAELHFCTEHDGFFRTAEVDEIRADTTEVGILTDSPRTVSIVVVDTGSCGL